MAFINGYTIPICFIMDPEKQKELNRLLMSVRNMLSVRAKLGAFDKLTPEQIDSYSQQFTGMHRWDVYRDTAKVFELLCAVNSGDIKSFYPILWLSDVNWLYGKNYQNRMNFDLIAQYDLFANRIRARMSGKPEIVEDVEPK